MTTEELVAAVVADSALIIGLGFVLGKVARRLGQPEVVGQIIAGIALGPSVLGRLVPELERGLFPPAVVACLTVIAQFGLVFFLFSVGYELDLRLLRRRRRTVLLVALSAFVLPMLLGAGSTVVFEGLYRERAGAGVPEVAFILFIAIAMSITAVPVMASILSELGVAGYLPGVVAMAAAGVIDAVGWLALTGTLFIAGTSAATGREPPVTLALFLAYLALMLLVVRPALRRWLRRPGSVRYGTPVIAVVAMASAWVTAALGLHVIFGAFLAGLIMPRTVQEAPDDQLVRPFQQVGNLILPVFFVVSGLGVNVTELRRGDLVLLAVVIVVAIVGKFGGGLLGARASGLTAREATVVGVLLNTRGLTELVALNIGLTAGIMKKGLRSGAPQTASATLAPGRSTRLVSARAASVSCISM